MPRRCVLRQFVKRVLFMAALVGWTVGFMYWLRCVADRSVNIDADYSPAEVLEMVATSFLFGAAFAILCRRVVSLPCRVEDDIMTV
jgi:hypothetical protein